jgi:hypothetical protein
MEVMVKRIKEAFDRLQPVFSRKVFGADDNKGRGLCAVGRQDQLSLRTGRPRWDQVLRLETDETLPRTEAE